MLFPQLEEKLQASKQALNTATSENIIEQCKQHLALLAEYRIQLYKLQDLPGVRQQSSPSLSGQVPDREAIRAAIETTTMSEIELRSFCSRSLQLVVMRLWRYSTSGVTKDMTTGNFAPAELGSTAETPAI